MVDTLLKSSVVPLWAPGTPGIGDASQPEHESFLEPRHLRIIRNVTWPTLTVYLPDPKVATGTGIVVAPGGAFHFLAIDHEGHDVARWLVERGIAAFVLRYRVIPTAADDQGFWAQFNETRADHTRMRSLIDEERPLSIADGRQAVQVAREHAGEWGVVSDRVGLMGFSAGAMVTLGVGLQYGATNRPSFIAPIYTGPVENPIVPADAPPMFLAMASDDEMAVKASLPLYSAWRDAGHSAELHIFAKGGHGFGMLKLGLPSDHWLDLFGEWLRDQGLLERPA
jgi:acetyl esterase/lipase